MKRTRRNNAQAIIVAGFLIAIGIVAIVALLNTAVLSVSEQPDTSERDVDTATNYRSTIVTESREALADVNEIAADKGLNNSQVNQTYVDYVQRINERVQEVNAGQGLVGVSNIDVNSSFNNAWRVRKNRTIPPTSQTRVPVDVVFVQDTSGSMSYPPGGGSLDYDCDGYGEPDNSDDKCYLAKEAAKGFVGSLKNLDRAAVVAFGADSGYDSRGLYKELTQAADNESKEEINQTIEELNADASTYLGGGIREAADELMKNSNGSREKYIIALSDGANTQGWVHFEDKYVYSNDDNSGTRHEWGYVEDSIDDDIVISDTRSGGYYNPADDDLNQRDITQAERANETGATIYTIGFGQGSLEEDHLRDIAGVTGNRTQNYYDADNADELGSAFNQIYQDISRPEPIASSVNRTYRMGINVTDFPGTGNVTLLVNKSSTGNLLWRMTVTNLSSSHSSPNHVVIDDGSTVLQKYDYDTLGGPPVDINVMRDSINGYSRNMSKGKFTTSSGYRNTTLEYSASVANVTYDVRVDDGANVTNRLCASPPCAGKNRQTVGSVHDTSFTISYRDEGINYSEPINLEANPVEEAAKAGGSPSSTSSSKTLNYSTPVYDYKAYYPLDKHYNDLWLEQHAFDASGNNQTMGVTPNPPQTDNFSVDVEGVESDNHGNSDDHAYRFDGGEYVRDLDGWNNIPINGTWTISMWFNPSGSLGDQVLFDASEQHSTNDKVFQIATRDDGGVFGDDKLVWSYEDTDNNQVTVESEFDSAFVDPISGSNGWHHVAVVGSWNNNRTQMFIDGQPASGSTVNMSGKPMQSTVNSDGDRIGSVYIGDSRENANGRPETDGFEGRIDDVRLYHKDLSDASISTTVSDTVYFEENFESGEPGDWDFYDSAGVIDTPSQSGQNSAYTCCEDGSQVRTEDVDLSSASASSTTLEAWIKRGDNSIRNKPEDGEELRIYYLDQFGNPQFLRQYDDSTHSPGDEVSVSFNLPSDALHGNSEIWFYQPDANSGPYDYWYIDDVRITESTESLSGISGTPGFIDDVFNDSINGYVTTGWKNFTDSSGTIPEDVDVDGLSLKDVDAELGGGEVSLWVQSDIDDDGVPDETSNKVEYDGNSSYDVGGLSTNNQRFRIKVAVNHTDATDAPKFYDAQLEAR